MQSNRSGLGQVSYGGAMPTIANALEGHLKQNQLGEFMNFFSSAEPVTLFRVAALFSVLTLAACGGGGGGNTAAPTPAPVVPPSAATSVTITATNAKAVAANALSATTNGVNLIGTMGFGLINSSTIDSTFLNKQQTCRSGGSAFVTGSIASGAGLLTGDSLNPTYTNCGVPLLGSTLVLNGSSTQTLTSGSAITLPFQIVFTGNVTNLSIGMTGKTFSLNGDQKLDWSVGSNIANQTMITSGTSLTNKSNVAGVLRTHVWQNYKQTLAANGVTNNFSFSGTVQSDNTNLGPAGGSYTLSTSTPVAQSASTYVLSAGALMITGASNSQIAATLGANNVVSLKVDANGDGTFETTIETTLTELNTFL